MIRSERPGPRGLDHGRRWRYVPGVKYLAWAVMAIAVACSGCEPGGEEVADRTLEVGCGTCQLGQTSHPGCWWAAKVDGRVVPVRGDALPSDREHDGHAPDGMCNMTRRAVVSGRLYESHLAVTQFDLLPVDPEDVPDGPTHEHRH